jgi:hypothetical protein
MCNYVAEYMLSSHRCRARSSGQSCLAPSAVRACVHGTASSCTKATSGADNCQACREASKSTLLFHSSNCHFTIVCTLAAEG